MNPIIPLAFYFTFNLALTLFNKFVLRQTDSPLLLTACHGLASFSGCSFLRAFGYYKPARQLSCADWIGLFTFAIIYTVNIAISNLSLSLVSLPLHQTVRATAPVITVLLSQFLVNPTPVFGLSVCLSLCPIVAGVIIAAYDDDYEDNLLSLLLTLLGAFSAVFKTIMTYRLQTRGPGLPALELIWLVSPFTTLSCLGVAYFTGELFEVGSWVFVGSMWPIALGAMLLDSCLAFFLNLASFTANKAVGALGMAVAANVKQVAILLVLGMCGQYVSWQQVLGTLITVTGGLWYSVLSKSESK